MDQETKGCTPPEDLDELLADMVLKYEDQDFLDTRTSFFGPSHPSVKYESSSSNRKGTFKFGNDYQSFFKLKPNEHIPRVKKHEPSSRLDEEKRPTEQIQGRIEPVENLTVPTDPEPEPSNTNTQTVPLPSSSGIEPVALGIEPPTLEAASTPLSSVRDLEIFAREGMNESTKYKRFNTKLRLITSSGVVRPRGEKNRWFLLLTDNVDLITLVFSGKMIMERSFLQFVYQRWYFIKNATVIKTTWLTNHATMLLCGDLPGFGVEESKADSANARSLQEAIPKDLLLREGFRDLKNAKIIWIEFVAGDRPPGRLDDYTWELITIQDEMQKIVLKRLINKWADQLYIDCFYDVEFLQLKDGTYSTTVFTKWERVTNELPYQPPRQTFYSIKELMEIERTPVKDSQEIFVIKAPIFGIRPTRFHGICSKSKCLIIVAENQQEKEDEYKRKKNSQIRPKFKAHEVHLRKNELYIGDSADSLIFAQFEQKNLHIKLAAEVGMQYEYQWELRRPRRGKELTVRPIHQNGQDEICWEVYKVHRLTSPREEPALEDEKMVMAMERSVFPKYLQINAV